MSNLDPSRQELIDAIEIEVPHRLLTPTSPQPLPANNVSKIETASASRSLANEQENSECCTSLTSTKRDGILTSVEKSLLMIDFCGSTTRLMQQFGQFRLSNRASSRYGHSRYFITEIGPGLFPGETHYVGVKLSGGSNVMLSSQSATKVHVSSDDNFASILYRFDVRNSSSLIALQAPTIAYGGAKLHSTVVAEVDCTSKAIISEIFAKVAPTPQSSDDTAVDLMIDIYYGDELLLVDRIATYATPIHTVNEAKSAIGGGKEVVGCIYFIGYDAYGFEGKRDAIKTVAGGFDSVELSAPTSPVAGLTLYRARGEDSDQMESLFAAMAALVQVTGI